MTTITNTDYQKLKMVELKQLLSKRGITLANVQGTGRYNKKGERQILKKDLIKELIFEDENQEQSEKTDEILNMEVMAEVYEKILDYVEVDDNLSTSPVNIYFWGYQDSDTEFQKQSNDLDIGVLARSENTAAVLLGLLSPIINGNYEDLVDDLNFYADKEITDLTVKEITDLTVKGAINLLIGEMTGSGSVDKYDISTKYTRTLIVTNVNPDTKEMKKYEEIITKSFQDIDIYNIKRIRDKVYDSVY